MSNDDKEELYLKVDQHPDKIKQYFTQNCKSGKSSELVKDYCLD